MNYCCRKGTEELVSREAFTVLGHMLKERRLKDYEADMGCHLTDSIGYVLLVLIFSIKFMGFSDCSKGCMEYCV